MSKIIVVGASGFIGNAVTRELAERGHAVFPLPAPRFSSLSSSVADIIREAHEQLPMLDVDIGNADVLVNAAGISDATSNDWEALVGANALLPTALALMAREAHLPRMVHISSAAVQGRRPLDESRTLAPESPYAQSKALAEMSLAELDLTNVRVFRPTSVHGPDRAISQKLSRLANSGLAVVARSGNDPTPQVHVRQVARAAAELADLGRDVPELTLQPWEGWTTQSFLSMLGRGKSPWLIPRAPARIACHIALRTSRRFPSQVGNARRLEMLLFGQHQAQGWLAHTLPELTSPHPDWDQFNIHQDGEKP